MNKILITGSSGFIGKNLIKFISDNIISDDFEIILLDINEHEHKNNYKFYKCDIRDEIEMNKIFEIEKNICIVIHLASLTGVRNSINNPKNYEEVNVYGMINLLEIAVKKYKVDKFIFTSSSSVYGDKKDFSPNSPYGVTKLQMEKYAELYSNLYNTTNFIALRFFTVYGPYGRKDMAPYIFLKSMKDDKEITIYDKESSRDFTFVLDVCNAIYQCIYKNFKLGFLALDIGSNNSYNIIEFVEICKKVTGKENVKLLYSKNINKYETKHTLADIENTKKYIDYDVSTNIYDGIVDMFNYIEEY